jgi:hypothetical protein
MPTMSDAEKRSVHTDALATLGTIISAQEKRDAIHLAVEPTVAAEKLYPGQDVGVDGTRNNPVGIVDPFLKSAVLPGDRFWLVVYPRQINSLRHVWTHPAFPDEPGRWSVKSKAQSEEWLRDFIARSDCPDYDIVIAAAAGEPIQALASYGGTPYSNDGEYLHFEGRDAHGEIPPEFWEHMEVVTGKKMIARASYFSCSC